MEMKTLQYIQNKGWKNNVFPDMDSEKTLILVFAAPEFIGNSCSITELSQRYPHSKMIGCSSAGEIFGSSIMDNSLSVALIKFEKTPLKIVKTEIKDTEDSFAAGERIAKALDKKDLTGIFVLSPGLNVNGSELVKGLNTIENKSVIITGGLAGDGKRFEKTWSIYNGELHTHNVVAVGFYGNAIQIGHASKGGWDIFGPERRITNSKDNILYELDERPALEFYKEYLGDRASGLPATGLLFPLAIRKDTDDAKQLVRTILAIDEKDQSLTFAGDVPTGYLAQLMRANFDRLVASASAAGETALETMNGQGNSSHNDNPVLAVGVSCVGRRLLLGERTEEETESMLEMLPKGTQQVGFYSYGELSPHTKGACDLHNQTMTLTTFYEN
jgi:hypothetical protein